MIRSKKRELKRVDNGYLVYLSVIGDSLRYPNYGAWSYLVYSYENGVRSFLCKDCGNDIHIRSIHRSYMEKIVDILSSNWVKENREVTILIDDVYVAKLINKYVSCGCKAGGDMVIHTKSDEVVLNKLGVMLDLLGVKLRIIVDNRYIKGKAYQIRIKMCEREFKNISGYDYVKEVKDSYLYCYDYVKRGLYSIIKEVIYDIRNGQVGSSGSVEESDYIDRVVNDNYHTLLNKKQKDALLGRTKTFAKIVDIGFVDIYKKEKKKRKKKEKGQ